MDGRLHTPLAIVGPERRGSKGFDYAEPCSIQVMTRNFDSIERWIPRAGLEDL